MKNIKKIKFNSLFRVSSGETGSAFIIVLIFLLLGSLTLVPALSHVGTALKTGEIYEAKTNEDYAADAGIEDAMWQIKYDGLEAIFRSPDYNYMFSTNASYLLNDPTNGYTTNVTVQNVWIPSNITLEDLDDLGLSAADLKEIIERPLSDNETNRLIITGTPLDADEYRIKIDYYPSIDVADNLSVSSVGIWLPQGFTYDGNCNLDSFAGTQDKYDELTGPRPGGQSIVWDFSDYPLPLTDFPPLSEDSHSLDSTAFPKSAEITFSYDGGTDVLRPTGIGWIVTAGPLSNHSYPYGGGIPISWDIDTRIYKIVSAAGDTEIEAYTSRSEMRNMYVATAGDYVAIGNSLMTDEVDPKDGKFRNYLWSSSDASLTSLPDDAYVSHAYLYWSGFFSSGFSTPFWGPDTCSNFDNWERVNQYRRPAADSSFSGAWVTSPWCSKVNEFPYYSTSIIDADYITGQTDAGGYVSFTFDPFTIPDDCVIANLTVYYRARDAASDPNPPNNIRARLKVAGAFYNAASSSSPDNSWNGNTFSYSFTTNPATPGVAWTIEDIRNDFGAPYPLQEFGVYSTNMDTDIQVSMVCAEVDCTSLWTISSDQFRGRGTVSATGSQRTLTLATAQDLSSRPAGSTIVEWMQRSSTNLEDDDDPANCDRLLFQVSNDDGLTWSEYITAFIGTLNTSSLAEYHYYVIPQNYLTDEFKIRFYVDGFNGSSEYCYLDDIAFATITGTADTVVDFTVDGYDTYTTSVNALVSQLIGNKDKGQYSFACWQEVTDLVNAHSERNADAEPIGNGVYTVGNLQSTPAGSSYQLAYAGWSLVIIYHSASTAGRQLYLWNYFSYSTGNENLDFDRDGSPGGTIKGFKVPERIGNETEAAKFTAFVGEGDGIYSGDQILFNGTALYDGYDINNVWNSQSVGMSKSGVDIDTFSISWESGLLHADDEQAQIDLPTDTDNYNLIYLILSVRSKTTIGATTHYLIRSG